jgi:hypothetical protein
MTHLQDVCMTRRANYPCILQHRSGLALVSLAPQLMHERLELEEGFETAY